MTSRNNNPRVSYAKPVYGKREIDSVMRVLSNPEKIVAGPRVRDFESRVAKLFGKRHGVMLNSGSSANLVALEVLGLKPGSEVITPALTFSTTVAPLIQKRLKPVFVDVGLRTYTVDVGEIERRITRRTRALMIPSLIGNFPDLARLRRIARKHRLWFIEDSCDTIGGSFRGKPSGFYSDISTTSFYASHIITAAGGGGMVCFHNPELARRARVMANWGRQSTLFGFYEKSEEITKRFSSALHGLPYDAKFIFSEIGYNFQPLELMGAFGVEQLGRLSEFAKRRRRNFGELANFMKRYNEFFILAEETDGAKVNWLAFPLMVRKGAPFTRHDITRYLEEHNIQTRPVMAGNILRQPGFETVLKSAGRQTAYPNANYIMERAFLIGCHQALTPQQLASVKSAFKGFLKRHIGK